MSRRITRGAKKREDDLQRKAEKEYRAEKPRRRTAEEKAREKFMREALKKEPTYRTPDDFSDFDEAYDREDDWEFKEEDMPDDVEDAIIDDLAEMDTDELEDISLEGIDEVSLRF